MTRRLARVAMFDASCPACVELHGTPVVIVRIKPRHLRHPIRAAAAARSLVAARLEMRQFALSGRRRFRNDPRYRLQGVTDGFAAHPQNECSDTALLQRIAEAYTTAVEQQRSAPEAYRATQWWRDVCSTGLRPVIHALSTFDLATLAQMYGSFFRNPCSTGLIAVPYGMTEVYFNGQLRDLHRHFYLTDTLHRLDYWRSQTGWGRPLSDLAGPAAGNPFGVVIDGTLVRAGSEYQHYCSQRIARHLDTVPATVMEIGGGYGGMAYYLLRDRPGTKYIDIDLPESIALAAYYLVKSFPELKFHLCGEGPMNEETLRNADVILLPVHCLTQLPASCAKVTFTSHAMSDLSSQAMEEYLRQIGRITDGTFIYVGNAPSHGILTRLIRTLPVSFDMIDMRYSGWNSHRKRGLDDVECTYRIASVEAQMEMRQ